MDHSALDSEESLPPVVLLDGHNLLYRAFFALPNTIVDDAGLTVNGLYGFFGTLQRLLADFHSCQLAIALDSAWPIFRHNIFPDYKARRSVVPPPEAVAQIPRLVQLVSALGIPVYSAPGYEADDILATVARHQLLLNESHHVIIVSTDKDLLQLVSNRAVLLRPNTRGPDYWTSQRVYEKYGVAPNDYPFLISLVGDRSDNISGLPGIGPKRASQILRDNDDFGLVIAGSAKPRGQWSELITTHLELLSRNVRLTTLVSTVPVSNATQRPILSQELDLSPCVAEQFLQAGLGRIFAQLRQGILHRRSSGELPTVRHRRTVGLVSCGRRKRFVASLAADLYTSPLFNKASIWARQASDQWFVLSGLHGLVSPTTCLVPYDYSLAEQSAGTRALWGRRVAEQLRSNGISRDDRVLILASSAYVDPLATALRSDDFQVIAPLRGLSSGRKLQWLNKHLEGGRDADVLDQLYELLALLPSYRLPALFRRQMYLPRRGLYFFLDPTEKRFLSASTRIVRVGTHAVSQGSASTLRSRLRAHYGVDAGGGNHRASIFRSHVGAAIISKRGINMLYPFWQERSVNRDILESERPLEEEVSEYLRDLDVKIIAIDDTPGPRSDRAYLERTTIALLASVGRLIDPPTDSWLGQNSPNHVIKRAGLWNVDHVGRAIHGPSAIDLLGYFVEATLGVKVLPGASLAPRGWWTERSTSQLSLLDEDGVASV